MNDVEAETALRHIGGELAGIVELSLEPGHHRQAHHPAVEAVQRTAQIGRSGVVLTEGGDDEHHTGNHGAAEQRDPDFPQFLLHLVMREHEVAQQEEDQVEQGFIEIQQAVQGFGTRVHDQGLRACPEQDAQQDDGHDSGLAAPFPTFILLVQHPHQQQHQGQEPEHLDEPERPDAADRPKQEFSHPRQAVERSAPGSHRGIEITRHPVEYQQADGTGNQQFARTGPEPFPGRMFLQGIAGADACQEEEQGHEPGIEDVHDHVLILRSVTEAADAAENTFVVVEIDYVVEQYQEYRHPAEIIQPMFSHIVRFFFEIQCKIGTLRHFYKFQGWTAGFWDEWRRNHLFGVYLV